MSAKTPFSLRLLSRTLWLPIYENKGPAQGTFTGPGIATTSRMLGAESFVDGVLGKLQKITCQQPPALDPLLFYDNIKNAAQKEHKHNKQNATNKTQDDLFFLPYISSSCHFLLASFFIKMRIDCLVFFYLWSSLDLTRRRDAHTREYTSKAQNIHSLAQFVTAMLHD